MEKEILKCDDCGITSIEVRRIICPYAEEILEKEVWVNLCPSCEHERAMDI